MEDLVLVLFGPIDPFGPFDSIDPVDPKVNVAYVILVRAVSFTLF